MPKFKLFSFLVFVLLGQIGLTQNYARDNSDQKEMRPTVSNKLKIEFELPSMLEETSGLIFWNKGLWTLNDSGNEPELYKVDTLTEEVVQTLRVRGIDNIDWEDLTQDEDFIYIGDFGDNKGERTNLRVLKIAKSNISNSIYQQVDAELINFSYADKPENIEHSRSHNYDCEAFASIGDQLFLFTKNRSNYETRCYPLSKEPGQYAIEPISDLNVQGLVTGADYNVENNLLVLIGYNATYTVPFAYFFWDFSAMDFFGGKKHKVNFVYDNYRQMEGVCFKDDYKLFLSCESSDFWSATIFSFDSQPWINTSIQGFDGDFQSEMTLKPNPCNQSRTNELQVDFSSLPEGDYVFSLVDLHGKELFIQKYRFKSKRQKLKLFFDVSGLDAGVYLINARSKEHFGSEKLIIY